MKDLSGTVLQTKSIRINPHYEHNRNSKLQWFRSIYLRKAAQKMPIYIQICKYWTDMNKYCSIQNS
jgi:hypothetical protein